MTQVTRAVPQPGLRAPGSSFNPQLPRLPVQHCPLYCSEGLVCSDVLPLHCCENAKVLIAGPAICAPGSISGTLTCGGTAVRVTASLTAVFVAGGGVSHPQALTATSVTVTASMVRRVNKGLTGTASVVTGSVVKRANKNLTATSVAVTASLVAIKVLLRTLTATSVVVTGTLSKQVGKTLTATAVALTGTIVRRVGKLVTGSSTVTASQVPTFISGGGVTNPKAMTATSVAVTASMTATFIPAPTFGVSVQDFSPILAAV